MPKNIHLESTLVGVAGEYFVAAELSIRGYLAAITLRNSRGVDIIVSSADTSKSVTIQVKTNSNNSPRWILNKKSEDIYSKDHFYVFVSLLEVGVRPDFYIVPSRVVAKCIATKHANWLAGKKSDGAPRKDSSMRKFIDEEGKYLEAWEKLGL